METLQLGLSLIFVVTIFLPLSTGGRGQQRREIQAANQCTLYQGGCKYQLILAGSNCHMSSDDPGSLENNNIELIDSTKQTEEQNKLLENLENRLTKMMEGLSVRSLRHIRQIKADLREMTTSMNLLKMKNGKKKGEMTCPPEFISVGTWSSCYRFSAFNATWLEARQYCSAFGANLVALDTMKEAYIIDYLIKSNPEYQIPKGWWTSGNYIVRSQKWMWMSRHHLKAIEYSRWAPGEPDARSTMHCLLLYKPAAYHWHDAVCEDRHTFICEIELY